MKITSSVKALVIGVLFLRGIGSVSAEIAHKLVPIEDFFSYSEISSVQVAPDGKHLAYLAPAQGRLAIMLFDLETGKAEVLARPTDENISFFFWKGSDTILYGGDLGGNESPALVAVNLKTRKFTHLVESLNERTRQDANFGRLVDALRFDPNHILIAGRSSVGSWHIQLSILDIRTAERKGIDGGDNETDEWIADNTGVIRARTRLSGEKNLLEVMPDSKSLFYPIAETPIELSVFGSLTSALIFAADNETLYLTKEDSAAGSSLYTYNTRTKQWSEPLFHIENGTIENVTLSWDRTRLIAARYITEEAHTKWFDPTLEKLTEKIKSSLKPETRIRLASMSQDEKVLAIYASSDVDPGTYYLLDLRGKPQLVQLGKVHSQLDPAQMQPMKPITYTARDGLVIHGYLTLPRGAAGKRVPLIINPHGGPYGIRDYWGYNPEVQFLANRGYAVLQANYRGSGGYGTKFLEAGKLEWGLKMQDDLTDAVNWAIDQGIADPKRVCIYGASYGGYAALAGVTYTPELYCCGINYVGVSDLSIITSAGRRFGRSSKIYANAWVGPDRDARSPVNFVERIRVPTLHAYGENDPRVDIKNWTELESALKHYNKPYEFVREENEGHGFRHEEARIKFYQTMEAFLAKHLNRESGGDSLTVPPESRTAKSSQQ